ncbi:MAG: AAA family ATPase [Candidatus Latescibacteria bacterium]|nr:AAA family ATPase [bacterium]MBD3425454.1 AAA family ATPase [Candidatus Latescibacterota bacterium]
MKTHIIDYTTGSKPDIAVDCEQAGWEVSLYTSLESFVASNPPETDMMIFSLPDAWDENEIDRAASKLAGWRGTHPATQVILLLPEGSRRSDRIAIEFGARHTLFKPYNKEDLFRILATIARGIGERKHRNAADRIKSKEKSFDNILGESRKIKEVISLSRKVAESPSTSIMITGENGTGKGALAGAIHSASPRRDGPFIEVNCAAIPKALLESEFFGHEKGAFTDAKKRKIGLFECANGGTIFLDEIGEIDYKLQAKLLKFLDSRTIRRVSGTQFLPVDIRIISATNRDLVQDVERKIFRADLFYRLNVIEINLPPLRDRIEDILPIAYHYTSKFAKRLKKGNIEITDEAIDTLQRYSWPGNIRELINIIERAVLLNTSGIIEPADLPINTEPAETTVNMAEERGRICIDLPPEGIPLDEIEKEIIIEALRKMGGNITAAARFLELERGTMRYKLKKYGIDSSEIKEKFKTGEYEPSAVTD